MDAGRDLVTETTRERARVEWSDWASRPIGWTTFLVVGVVGGAIAYFLVPADWSDPLKGVVSLLVGAVVTAIFAAGVFWGIYLVAPRWQRDESRERLRTMKRVKGDYALVLGEPVVLEVGERGYHHIYVPVRNHGRGAHFAAMVERFQGMDEELRHPHARLHWGDREGIEVEEIPPGDGRRIGIGEMVPAHGGWRFRPFSPDGIRQENYTYGLPEPGTAIVWCRVSSRSDPDTHYSRVFGIAILCETENKGPFSVSLVDPPDGETNRSFERFDALFEFDA